MRSTADRDATRSARRSATGGGDEGLQPAAGLLRRRSVQVVLAGICALVAIRTAWLAIEHHAAPPLGELPSVTFQLDPNRADALEFSLLPGIGPTLAERIVSHREQFGPFSSVQELEQVHGIGEVTIERIRPHVRIVRPP